MKIKLSLNGELIQKLQSMVLQQLNHPLQKLTHMVNLVLGNQILRSKFGKSQLFMNTHTSIHLLELFIMLMAQELLKMEEHLLPNL